MSHRRRDVLRAHAKPAAHDATVLAQLFDHFLGRVDGNREADADVAARLTKDRAIDTHDLADRVDQGSAAVSRIDRGVGLNEVIVGPRADDPSFGADNSRRHRMFQAKRIADRHDPIADLQWSRRPELGERQIAARFSHLNQCQVCPVVFADKSSLVFSLIGELNFDGIRIPHHVVIGQNFTVLSD